MMIRNRLIKPCPTSAERKPALDVNDELHDLITELHEQITKHAELRREMSDILDTLVRLKTVAESSDASLNLLIAKYKPILLFDGNNNNSNNSDDDDHDKSLYHKQQQQQQRVARHFFSKLESAQRSANVQLRTCLSPPFNEIRVMNDAAMAKLFAYASVSGFENHAEPDHCHHHHQHHNQHENSCHCNSNGSHYNTAIRTDSICTIGTLDEELAHSALPKPALHRPEILPDPPRVRCRPHPRGAGSSGGRGRGDRGRIAPPIPADNDKLRAVPGPKYPWMTTLPRGKESYYEQAKEEKRCFDEEDKKKKKGRGFRFPNLANLRARIVAKIFSFSGSSSSSSSSRETKSAAKGPSSPP